MPEKVMQKVWKMIPKCIQNGSQNPSKILKIPEKTASENWCRNLMPTKTYFFSSGGFSSILDRSQLPTAIFPHRALEKRKREVKTSFGLCFEWIQKDYNRNCYKMHVKIIIFGPKTFKISSNWHPKSMSKPWKIEVVSRMRFWSGPWVPTGGSRIYFWDHFGDQFRLKIEKKAFKKACKNQARKSIEN